MSCPHASGCPLFPYLNASLASWRESYCDHDHGWQDCARYIRSGQGKPVPLALLPNGRMPAEMLPDSDRSETVAHQLVPGEPVVAQSQPAGGVAPVSAEPDTGAEAQESTGHVATETRSPSGRPSWWRRMIAWLGGTE